MLSILLPSFLVVFIFFFQAEDGIRYYKVTGVQTCALPICTTRLVLQLGQSDPKVMRHLRELENETRRTVAQLQSFLSYASGERVQRRPQDVNELDRKSVV